MQWGVKKATQNEESKKGGRRAEKERKRVSKREPKVIKTHVKNEAEKGSKHKGQNEN